jgi:hypothetical protein
MSQNIKVIWVKAVRIFKTAFAIVFITILFTLLLGVFSKWNYWGIKKYISKLPHEKVIANRKNTPNHPSWKKEKLSLKREINQLSKEKQSLQKQNDSLHDLLVANISKDSLAKVILSLQSAKAKNHHKYSGGNRSAICRCLTPH